MNVKLILNVALAALAAGAGAALAILTAAESYDKALFVAAGYAALRAIIGYLAGKFGHPVPVDS